MNLSDQLQSRLPAELVTNLNVSKMTNDDSDIRMMAHTHTHFQNQVQVR